MGKKELTRLMGASQQEANMIKNSPTETMMYCFMYVNPQTYMHAFVNACKERTFHV